MVCSLWEGASYGKEVIIMKERRTTKATPRYAKKEVKVIDLGDLATGTAAGIVVALGCTSGCCNGSQRMAYE